MWLHNEFKTIKFHLTVTNAVNFKAQSHKTSCRVASQWNITSLPGALFQLFVILQEASCNTAHSQEKSNLISAKGLPDLHDNFSRMY